MIRICERYSSIVVFGSCFGFNDQCAKLLSQLGEMNELAASSLVNRIEGKGAHVRPLF